MMLEGGRWLVTGAVGLLLVSVATAEKSKAPEGEFGQDIQLAPFVVSGKKISVSIHARTNSDRRYGEEFAEEVLEVAYHTIKKSTGAGLVIVGKEGEPHPVEVMRKFLALVESGQLGPEMAAKAADMSGLLKELKVTLHLDEAATKSPDGGFKLTFDMLMPALPLPLEGAMAKLYLISWAEGFDEPRVEQKLRALTLADLQSDTLAKYDWVFYLPPRKAYVGVQDTVMKQAMKHEKMGLGKRMAIRSALVVFKPAVKKAVEGMRRGMLYLAVLRAESDFSREDINALTKAYVQVLMPDFKITAGSERERAFAAVDKQKLANEDYARNPFVSPPRLADYAPADFAKFEGAYAAPKSKSVWRLIRKDDAYLWQFNQRPPVTLYPAGERLFVSADGKMTIEFKVDEHGAVIGAEGRRRRERWTIPPKLAGEPAKPRTN